MASPNFVDKTIWSGDNLDILRGMNSECVDLIYLDPPFNSNKTYEAPVGSRAAGAARTTSITCNSCAPTATGSKETGLRNISRHESRRWRRHGRSCRHCGTRIGAIWFPIVIIASASRFMPMI